MTVKKLLCLLVALVIILLLNQCDIVFGGSSRRNYRFEQTAKAEARQERYRKLWKDLVRKNEITESIENGFPTYKFVGVNVRKMKVKNVFVMLQNWMRIQSDAKHRIIEMNIGGEAYRFRMYLGRRLINIVIADERGDELKPYEFYFNDIEFAGEDIQQIAGLMLQSAREPMNAQTEWPPDFLVSDTMREFMVVTQVAEAARPTKESFKEFKKIMDEVADTQIGNEFIRWRDGMRELLNEYKESEEWSKEQYNVLKKQLLLNDVRNRDELPTIARQLVASVAMPNDFLELLHLPSDMKKLPPEFKKALIERAKRVISETDEVASEEWKERVKDYAPKNGRIPGSDKVARRILNRISQNYGRHTSFRDAFENLFPISDTTKKGRERLFALEGDFSRSRVPSPDSVPQPNPSQSSSSSESDSSSSDLPAIGKRRKSTDNKASKRQRLNSKGVATGDGDKSAMNEAITAELKDRSCKRRRKRAGSCTVKPLKVVDESIKWEETKLSFETIDEDGKKLQHEIEIDLEKLSAPEYTKEHLANFEESGLLKGTASAGKALGVYGAAVGILASIQYFSQDEYGRGAFSAIQATHAIGGLTGVNDVVAKVTKQAIRKGVTLTAEKIGLERTLERMSELGAKALGESTSKVLRRLAGDLPFVGVAFDLYFISEDIEDLNNANSSTPEGLKVLHLVLDIETTVLTLIETAQPELTPLLEPLVLGLTIIRISIDNFYLEIEDELSKVKGKGFGEQVWAFLKGYYEGVGDFFTLGLVQQIKGLKRQQEYDRELLRNLTDPASYFNITFQGMDENGETVGTVDFTAGILSEFGGFLTVKLNNNGSFTVELPEVPTESGIPTRVVKTFSFSHPVNDIVLGVGQVANPKYRHEEAKLWLFIPVEGFDIIDNFEAHESSQYGVYTGNSDDNNFYAVQGSQKRKRSSPEQNEVRQTRASLTGKNCTSFGNFSMNLNSYHYDLYGRGGNDRFFLGPQTSRVSGDEDSDLYYTHATGGRAIIDNFAHDQEMDTLFLNVSYRSISCHRKDWDLLVSYCQDVSHAVKIKNWFVHGNEQFHRHIYLATMDGVVIEVTGSRLNGVQHQVNCDAVSVDRSSSTLGVNLTLTDSLSEVKQATGSNFSDVISGNEKANILKGGLGDDVMTGDNGSDIYLVERDDGTDTICNYAGDKLEDTVLLGIPYAEISVEAEELNLIVFDSSDRMSTQVAFDSWFEGPEWQHAVFVSRDYIRFVVREDDDGVPEKHPLSIDLTGLKHGVRLNLQNTSNNRNISVNEELADEVKVVLDSPYNDTLIGNRLGNFFSCSNGSDFLQGNGGKDTYVIEETCYSVTIQNIDEKGDFDLLLLSCLSLNMKLLFAPPKDLTIKCELSSGQFDVILKKWFESPKYRHLIVKTSDKVTALLPEDVTELNSTKGQLFPYQIEADEDCKGELREVNLMTAKYSKCERFTAKTDACSYSITGNALNNYIDPGPGNPYGYQHLKGNNGSDTYVMGYNYGVFNTIDNFAEDGELDHLKFDVVFHDIEVSRSENDTILISRSKKDSVRVTVLNYYAGVAYQHLLVHSIDGVLFKFSEEFPFVDVYIADFSASTFSHVMSAQENSTFSNARVILGSKVAENYIEGGQYTTKIIGGQKNDTIIGGPGGEDLIGFDGADSIYGGPGYDALYGGDGDDYLDGGLDDDMFYGSGGADTIKGGPGSNTVVFSGYNYTGVIVDLQIGLGWNADAEGDTYEEISNVLGSEYDDLIIGNDYDNVIRGYGGEDFIVSAGGDDLLQGGTGTDFYQLENAYGHKLINNFATDEELDMILMNQTSSERICYYFYGEDLQLNVNYDDANSTDAVARVSLDEDFLMITIPFWLRNSTYRHVVFSLLDDHFLTPEDFDENGKQLEPMIDLVRSGNLLLDATVEGNSITLHFNLSALDALPNSSPEAATLSYVHMTPYSTPTYYLMDLEAPRKEVKMSNLSAGTTHSFILALSSCELTVAMSPLVYTDIPPNQPINLQADPIFVGFNIRWDPPNNLTDPSVDVYEYIVSIWSVSEPAEERLLRITSDTSISVFSLVPETVYNISISSLVDNVTSLPSQLLATTAGNACNNLVNLSSHMLIEDLAHDEEGQIIATLSCETGYALDDNTTVTCNDSRANLPQCILTSCPIPIVANALLIVGNETARYGDTFTWECNYGYEIRPDATESFSSVCLEQLWYPEVRSCQEKPKCLSLDVPQNGSVNATTAYVGEAVSYSCVNGHVLQGPVLRHCTGARNVVSWEPPIENEVSCMLLVECPSLLPQTHGNYSLTKPQYITGDSVELVCSHGYYAKDDLIHPEREEFTCTSDGWYPPQRLCQSLIEVTHVEHHITHALLTVQYVIPSLQGTVLDDELQLQVCQQVLPTTQTHMACSNGCPLKCTRSRQDYRLSYGPSSYEGILTIRLKNGIEGVCIENSHLDTLTEVCKALGYGSYTSSLYEIPSPIMTTFKPSSDSSSDPTALVPAEKQCYSRISCRKTCDRLYLYNGNWENGDGCPYTLEGQTCRFNCNAGYGLVGPLSTTCTSTGWSESHPFCDGESWKADVEREARMYSYFNHNDLAAKIKDSLVKQYPGVNWVVIVYDVMEGSQRHGLRSLDFYVHHLYNYYGHNIVVGRLINPGPPPPNLNDVFWQAYSPQFDSTGWWGWGPSVLNAGRTASRTEREIINRGISNIMLHIFTPGNGVHYSAAWNFDGHLLHVRLPNNQGYATLIAA